MRGKILLIALVAAVVISSTLMAPAAQANCFFPTRYVKTYWGGTHFGQPICPQLVGPPIPWDDLVGQEIWDCDGTYSSWGLTCSWGYEETIEICPPVCFE